MKEVTVAIYIVIALFNAESGRPDVVSTINYFVFTPASKSAFENFTIVDDDVLEFDEIFIAEFYFGPYYSNTWNAIKGEPSTTFIVIRDDDCELIAQSLTIDECICIVCTYIVCTINIASTFFFYLLLSSAVVVTFHEGSYTAEEIVAQISVSLRIDGKFFYPVWAVVEISDGTATGGLY